METTTETNSLVQIIETSGLEKSKAQVLLDNFSNYFEIAAEWEAKINGLNVTDINQKAEMKMAGEARKFLKAKRIDVEKTRKDLKEQSLREGQIIDSIAKVLKNLIEPLEDKAELIEKFAEIKEQERKNDLQAERFKRLMPFNTITDTTMNLCDLSDEAFENLFNGYKLAFEAKEAEVKRLEAERIAKEKADAEERIRIKAENEKLLKEAEEREKAIAKERAKAEAERKEAEAKAAKEREIVEAKAKKERAEQEAKLKKEREEREKAEAELRAKKEEEEKAKRDAELLAEAELSKGDKDKFLDLLSDLELLKYKHQFKTKKYKSVQVSINELLEKVIVFSKGKI